jgi:hypothetical protein
MRAGEDVADGMGGARATEAGWRSVADTLRQLHRLTAGWPQRPGWRSSTNLLRAETGTKIDLGAMPAEGVARCRAAWARLVARPTCFVHGDPNPQPTVQPFLRTHRGPGGVWHNQRQDHCFELRIFRERV